MSLDFWWGVFAGVSFGVLVLLVVLGISAHQRSLFHHHEGG